ncbi:MAG: ROK family protein [Spirochaetaceae bacterium]|nr:MAG: ROK family protein [Spirochaetaceae bacterium]
MRIGFDLGGTKMLAVVLDGRNHIQGKKKARTLGGGNEAVAAQIAEVIRGAMQDADITAGAVTALGVAVAGPINAEKGMILEPPNLDMRNFSLAEYLQGELGIPVFLENDVNAGLWGEYVAGAARGYRHVIGIFPGTGIGGGLILDGVLYRGKLGAAGEIGHITVQPDGRRCGCGNFGCLEAVASRTAIARDLVLLAANGQSPVLAEAGATDIRLIKSGLIARALDAGDSGVAEVVEQAAGFLGIGMAAMVNTFDPELIVVGGGLVEKLGDRYLKPAESMMRRRAMRRLVADVIVSAAALGDEATVIGAADLAERAVKSR